MAEKWLIELNIIKCSVLSITLKCNYCFHDYDILGATLKPVTNHDYLGVTISSDLNWLRHINKIKIRLAEPLVYFTGIIQVNRLPFIGSNHMNSLLRFNFFQPNLCIHFVDLLLIYLLLLLFIIIYCLCFLSSTLIISLQ